MFPPPIGRVVEGFGWRTPTPIQTAAWPPALAGRSLIGIAKTGSGKTGAFLLPLLSRLSGRRAKPRRPLSLILTPTRELAVQIAEIATPFLEAAELRMTLIYGGVGYAHQRKALSTGVEIAVATPGRLEDLHHQGHVLYDAAEILVLDEADRMLDMGFIEPITAIWQALPRQHQALLFSATFPPPIRRLASHLAADAVELSVDAPSTTVESVDQIIWPVAVENKLPLLAELLSGRTAQVVEGSVVFTNSRSAAGRVVRYLSRREIPVGMLHGGMSQSARLGTLQQLQQGEVRHVVATDVAARGIDFESLSHVVNFEVPLSAEAYVHRIGRTARAGASGTAITFVAPGEAAELQDLARHLIKQPRVESKHPHAAELPTRPQRRRKRGEAPEPTDGTKVKTKRLPSGKTIRVEYKPGQRRRGLSGKIHGGRGIRREDDQYKPAWKKRRPKRKKG